MLGAITSETQSRIMDFGILGIAMTGLKMAASIESSHYKTALEVAEYDHDGHGQT